jgi:hypothetical protein
MNSSLARRTSVAILAMAWHITAVHAQSTVQWAAVGGTSQTDALLGSALGPAGEIYLVGAFGYTDYPNLAETVLFKYDSKGQLTATQAAHGDGINDVAVDSKGSYFLTGNVWDPDMLGTGRSFDFYLARYGMDGTLLWERTAGTLNDSVRSGGKEGQSGNKIALDTAGNVYVAGRSFGPAVFGDTTFPASPGGPLLCKYTPDGALLWAKRGEGKGLIFDGRQDGGGDASGIVLDADGNIVINGTMTKGPAVFDGIVIDIFGAYDYGAFAAKYNPAGQILWAKAIPLGAVGVDRQGNTLISGPTSHGQANFDGTSISLTDPSGYTAFVAKFDPAGELLWAKAAPSGGLIADRQGNIYTGSAKLDPAGEIVWARIIPGASLSVVALNDRDEPVFTGTIKGTVNLDENVVRGDGDSYDDYVVCKASVNGKFKWAFALTTGNLEPGLSQGNISGMQQVLCDRDGNVVIEGRVNCPWSFAPQTFVCDGVGKFEDFPISVQAGGVNDFFLARIGDPAPATVALKGVKTTSGLALSWPASFSGFVVETANALPATNWSAVLGAPSIVGDQNVITVGIGSRPQFFRLRKL